MTFAILCENSALIDKIWYNIGKIKIKGGNMMKFKLFNRELEVETINYEEPIISPHTGKELERMNFDIKVIGASTNDDIQARIPESKNGGIFSIDDDENELKEYRLIKYPYSYNTSSSDENRVYNYTLHLEEVERLNIESLIIGDLEIFPYEYEEEYDDAIISTVKVKLTKIESEKLDSLDGLENKDRYFKVIRKGISEDKLDMRFGQVIWSEDGDFIKKKMTLVEKIYDENEETKSTLFQPEMGNMRSMIAYNRNLTNELMDLLLSKGVISSDEIEEIKEKAGANLAKTYRKFYKVSDVDEF